MKQIAVQLFAGAEILIFTLCAVWMLRLIPRQRQSSLWVRTISWLGFAALSVLLPNLGKNDIFTITVLTLYYLALGWFLYHKSRMGLLYQTIYMISMYATQMIAIFLTVQLLDILNLTYPDSYYMVSFFKTVLLMMILGVLRGILRRRYVKDQKNLKIRGAILVPLISIILIFLYLISGEVFFARCGYGWLIMYCCLILVMNAYYVYFWYDVAANQALKHKLELMQQQNELTHQYYADLEENYNRSRKVIHDIRNHIQVLEESQKLDKVQDYMSDVHEMLNSLGLRFYSENRMLNIVLNHKLKHLPAEQVECRMGGVNLNFLSDMDITTIFANLLDNVLEAGENRKEFWLEIYGEQIQDFTLIRISNPCSGQYEPGSSEKQGHEGIGLENVRQAVEKYHGELNIRHQENIFSVILMFPGQ
ncbi:MAG: GHKL domain-containing protein [Eubacteriales bacterium]|nr:GHKL domain-containing protein [Eubacteriales bacterium]